MWDRRSFLFGLGSLALLGCSGGEKSPVAPGGKAADDVLRAALAAIEKEAGGRLGAFVLDTGSGRGVGHREGERFGMCSTFKLSLAALIFREADAGRLRLDERLAFTRADLVPHSPVTELHADEGGMTVEALAEAAQTTSDNTATNTLLARIGGPAAITAFWRELGDTGSRLDRIEPQMNLVPAGEVRDTVIPEGIARVAARITTGDVLSPASRARLIEWMERTETGKKRIRAGLPAGWRGGDKTGTANAPGMPNKTNDIALLMPPGGARPPLGDAVPTLRAPIVVVGFLEADGAYDDVRPGDEAALAKLGSAAVTWALGA